MIASKKTTIKSLLSKEQLPKKLPTLNESGNGEGIGEKKDSSFNDSFSKYQLEKPNKSKISPMEKSGLDYSIVDKLSEKFRISEES